MKSLISKIATLTAIVCCLSLMADCGRITAPQNSDLFGVSIETSHSEYFLNESKVAYITIKISNSSGYDLYLQYCGSHLIPYWIEKKGNDAWTSYGGRNCEVLYTPKLIRLEKGGSVSFDVNILSGPGVYRFKCPIHLENSFEKYYNGYSNEFQVLPSP